MDFVFDEAYRHFVEEDPIMVMESLKNELGINSHESVYATMPISPGRGQKRVVKTVSNSSPSNAFKRIADAIVDKISISPIGTSSRQKAFKVEVDGDEVLRFRITISGGSQLRFMTVLQKSLD